MPHKYQKTINSRNYPIYKMMKQFGIVCLSNKHLFLLKKKSTSNVKRFSNHPIFEQFPITELILLFLINYIKLKRNIQIQISLSS